MRRVTLIAVSGGLILALGLSEANAQTKKKDQKKGRSAKEELLIDIPKSDSKSGAKPTDEYVTPKAKARSAPIESVSEAPLPQYYWQAKSDQLLANPFIEAAFSKNEGTLVNGTPGGQQYSVSDQIFRAGVETEFGLLESISLGGRLSYYMSSTKEDVGSKNGIEDVVLYTKGNWAFSSGSIHYGLRIGFSPGDGTDDGQGNTNAFSGGPSYRPYLGYSKKFTSGFAGLDISYEYKGDRTIDFQSPTVQSTKKTLSGGHVLALNVFYEKMSTSWNFGTYVGFTSESQKEFKSPNQTNPTPTDGGSNFILGAYAPMMYGVMIVTPKLEFRNFLDDQLGNRVLDVNWTILARCDVRFTF
ncbi:MAG: hypothetical protein SGJ18_04645 [Pseudomonadota bacterium]|nr:hypothetical protein [Pseudomonadota bacterium]